MTRDELWAEAQRLARPTYQEGIDSVVDPARVELWWRAHEILAVTLACFSDWDEKQLRATAKEHRIDGDRIDQPCGYDLLVTAALLCGKTPAERKAILGGTFGKIPE
jgi:hypothetical protein